jgi:hypothetical protein
MKFASASKVDRKSGVRLGEPGAPVLLLAESPNIGRPLFDDARVASSQALNPH